MKNTEADDNASKKNKNRGYAFVVYEREKDMKGKYFSLSHFAHLSPLSFPF